MELSVDRVTFGTVEQTWLRMPRCIAGRDATGDVEQTCPSKPQPLPVMPDGIPQQMKAARRWVVWNYEWKGERWTKVPYIATAPARKASSTNPNTWSSFEDAHGAYEDGKCEGIGFVLGDGWVGYDQDDNGDLSNARILNSYTERSPGGDGLHTIVHGSKPGAAARRGGLELYDKGRYFTVTGHHVEGFPTTVEERTAEIASLYNVLFSNGDADLIAKAKAAKHGDKFAALWDGDTSGYPSPSEAVAALCARLAFWTNNDPAAIDRLFRQSKLYERDKKKWERVGQQTIAFVLKDAAQSHLDDVPPPVDEESEPEPAPPVEVPYSFTHAFPEGHFVTTWIERFGSQCDAAREFHEASALVALAQATPSLTARISGSADGLRTNLYVLLMGDPGRSRKSTAKDYAVQTVRHALPHVLLPEQMSQESFVESLTHCNGGSALWAIDEFTDTLSKMVNANYLAGMRGILLEMYSRTDYTYRRVSKRITKKKDDGEVEREEDAFQVHNVTLSVIGCATPTLFRQIDSTAVGSGLLTRFAVIMPESKPPRLPQFELADDPIPAPLVKWLHDVSLRTARMGVTFESGVLERIDDAIDRPLDESQERCHMTVRMGVMARKVAMLSAAGRRPEESALEDQYLRVTPDDADAAIRVVTRWIEYAREFESRIEESAFEGMVQKCVEIIKGRTLERRVIARRVHVSAKDMTEIERTLQMREQIDVIERRPQTGRPSVTWRWKG